MSLALPHNAAPEALPNFIPAHSGQSVARPLKSNGRGHDATEGSFAGRLNETQSKAGDKGNSSGAAVRMSDKTITDKTRFADDDTTEIISGEALTDSLRMGVPTNKTNSSFAQTKDEAALIGAFSPDRAGLSVDGFGLTNKQVVPGSGSIAQILAVNESGLSASALLSPSRSVAALNELTELYAVKSDGDLSRRAEAEFAKLQFVAKEQLSGADAKTAALLFNGSAGADKSNLSNRSSLNPALSLAGFSDKASGAGPDVNELFQRYGIEKADLEKSANGAERRLPSAAAGLRVLALAPNIRRALYSSTQYSPKGSKVNDINGSAQSRRESNYQIMGEQNSDGGMRNTSGTLNNGLPTGGHRSSFTSMNANSMLLHGATGSNAALIEEFGALVTGSVSSADEPASGVISRRPLPLRAGFILPERFGQTIRSGVKSITLQITPKHLGSAQLSVTVVNDIVSGTLLVESAAARIAVEASIEQLAQRLAEEGLSLDKLDVEVSKHHRRQEEFNSESRSEAEKQAAAERNGSKDMKNNTQSDGRGSARQSIVTASRIDAVV
ncbi:MAG: flagellar hook-length control protein FliK [candidate division Zixibacteria bacterium]|nr:flagellar hook-length control protein FliK [candidate division Zixibacteria bacterium]